MSKSFHISKVNKLGDLHETYGQAFWAEVQEQLEPVKFNLMQGDVQAGDVITCEEVLLKESKKGDEYHQLKKVRIVNSSAPSVTAGATQATPTAPSEHKLDQILELVKEINAKLEPTYLKKAPGIDGYEGDPIFDESGAPIQEYS